MKDVSLKQRFLQRKQDWLCTHVHQDPSHCCAVTPLRHQQLYVQDGGNNDADDDFDNDDDDDDDNYDDDNYDDDNYDDDKEKNVREKNVIGI